jgi:4-amino-4-deoxy-L-arabinose transferase-like glycosyltransferase
MNCGPSFTGLTSRHSFLQSFYFDLLLEGASDDPSWLSIPAIDLPPLPKYLIGLTLRTQGYPRPGPSEAMAWYYDNSRRYETPEMLVAARWPSVILGALGCIAVFYSGALVRDLRTGAIAALLLLMNPLYHLLARQAMADIPCEALVQTATVSALWFWQRTLSGRIGPVVWIGAVLGVGILAGLAALAKLNGILALMTIGSWAVLALTLPRVPVRRKASIVGSALLIDAVAIATFVLLNPTMTARPAGRVPRNLVRFSSAGIGQRLSMILLYRVNTLEEQRSRHSHYALHGPWYKVKAVAIQGFGRFGPFGPRLSHFPVLYDWVQDRWAIVWGPWVLLGAVWAAFRGRSQLRAGVPPTAWAILLQTVLALVMVTVFIPLAWDRYYLPIEAGVSLLAAGVAVATFDRLVEAFDQLRQWLHSKIGDNKLGSTAGQDGIRS